MKVHLFFNSAAAAGRSAMRLGATLATFRTLGVTVELHRPSSGSAALSEMQELAGKVERIVVVGGDGVVHQAANALAGSDTVLGIISAGTGNDAVKSLGLPHQVDDACKTSLRDPKAIDLIESEAGLAVTVATAGFSVAVNDRADEMKRVKGGAKYTLSSLIELPALRHYELSMTLDGERHDIDANLIAVANTSYFGGGMRIAPDAELDDGQLDVIVIGPAPRAAFAAVLPTVFVGRHVNSRYVKTYRAREVSLAGNDLAVRADGEDYGHLPATFTVRARGLLVAGVVD